MSSKILYLMRHAETLFNVQGKTQGWCDSPLTARGVEQAKRAGRMLAERGLVFDHAYSSTSERCCDTLEIATEEAFGLPMDYVRLKDLREVGFGAYEAKDAYLEPSDFEMRRNYFVQFGGEALDQVAERMDRCLSEIMSRDDHACVFAVSSGGSSRNFYALHEDTAECAVKVFGNCMTYVYEWNDGIFTCKEAFIPDFSDLEAPGLPPQVRPANRLFSQAQK